MTYICNAIEHYLGFTDLGVHVRAQEHEHPMCLCHFKQSFRLDNGALDHHKPSFHSSEYVMNLILPSVVILVATN